MLPHRIILTGRLSSNICTLRQKRFLTSVVKAASPSDCHKTRFNPARSAALAVGAGVIASSLAQHSYRKLSCHSSSSNEGSAQQAAQAAHSKLKLLEEELRCIAQGTSGHVGLSVASITHPDLRVSVNGGDSFPMASTFKVPLAVATLKLVDAGRLQLSDVVTVDLQHARPGTGVVTSTLLESGPSQFSIYALLELALNDSDNTASDVLLEIVGGPQAVTALVRSLGLERLTVSRSCLEHIRDRCGILQIPEKSSMVDFVAMLEGRMELQPLAILREADAAFDADARDTTTPDEMTQLLQLIWTRKSGLSENATQTLLDIMANCRTGRGRIPGRLPAHMGNGNVMHKTGSLGGRTNDVGFLVLPGGNVFALSVYIMGPPGPGQTSTREMYAERDRIIADMARSCYDFFLFQT